MLTMTQNEMRKSFGEPIMNAKETKQLFLRG
jgi:hypothetical protein